MKAEFFYSNGMPCAKRPEVFASHPSIDFKNQAALG